MFPRLAEQYRTLVHDLVMSLQALARSLQDRGCVATCYVCGDGRDGHGASFVADLGDNHTVRFLVSDFGITWVESRDGHELVKLEGAEAIQELQRVTQILQQPEPTPIHSVLKSGGPRHRGSRAASEPIETAA
ncbi:DUF1815 family protein [Synechococcus sp. CCY9201]|uniref:DUF1815 family protein n=1 Tax=unclassified Synechococcus TaxID=2626047 RepID=UPI0018CCB210|nr:MULTISPECIES: DUF1815 family protein [unclassified Synechococcus]MEA5422456.1 DUF1815 family protein [Synechococcus sp. CCY9202]MEA5475650.1 DUF1815 family protein [Synechococcus sp. CCY9201]QPN61242.1 DUF1815 family protein [Synechococcus sp. CBW1002]CAK6701270.1 hypothetical protein IFHNHDMJ_03048 [Synechococcus sp. CBW1107]